MGRPRDPFLLVVLIVRFLSRATYLLGDILPSSKEAAYATMGLAVAAGMFTKSIGFQSIFGAAWSAIEM